MTYQYHVDGTSPAEDDIFVFGSNLAGYHGAGAAKYARESRGAKMGVAHGITGTCYAIATKDVTIRHSLTLEEIAIYVNDFLECARMLDNTTFFVTRIGCVLAGYTNADIAPLFKGAPSNCNFAEEWKEYLE